jgi:hypothetical protein
MRYGGELHQITSMFPAPLTPFAPTYMTSSACGSEAKCSVLSVRFAWTCSLVATSETSKRYTNSEADRSRLASRSRIPQCGVVARVKLSPARIGTGGADVGAHRIGS